MILLLALLSPGVSLTQVASGKDVVDLVSPNIGSIGHLLTATVPYVQFPHGMARVAPVTTPGIVDRYLADRIFGFPVGGALLAASTGPLSTKSAEYASEFDHDFEVATPYHYSAELQTWGIHVDVTTTRAAIIYRFTFPKSSRSHIVVSSEEGSELRVVNDHVLAGSRRVEGPVAPLSSPDGTTRQYFYLEASKPFGAYRTWNDQEMSARPTQRGDHIGFVSDQSARTDEVVEVRVGISYIDSEQAKRNLEEQIGKHSFSDVEANNRAAWEQALSRIEVTGGTDKQRTIFYTALYRSLCRMTDITEDGRYYSGYDHSVHDSQGHDFYVDDGLWDTFRSMHPLQTLIEPERQNDLAQSYVRMYEQSGWVPSFPSAAGEQAVMIGHHAAEFLLDLYAKGFRDFDLEKAYSGLRKNETDATLLPWKRGSLTSLDKVFFERGFFPSLAAGATETEPAVTSEKRQAVSVTLETCYDDWAVAQFARGLGHSSDAAYFEKLAANYKTVFNPAINFMAPRSVDGRWVTPFDPKLGGGQGARDYFTEVNSWIYTFNVQFDVAGLIDLMGGRTAFNARLDQLFTEQYDVPKYQFLDQFPDATGLVGLYAQGNEPSFHIPYLYDFSGQPWKTQRACTAADGCLVRRWPAGDSWRR